MEDKQKLEYETQIYCGKQLKKKGDGWTLFKTFWGDTERPWTRQMFSRDTKPKNGLALEELEEGNEYTYGYTEYKGTHPEYGEYVSKTIQFVTEPEERDRKIPVKAEDEKIEVIEVKKKWVLPAELKEFVEEILLDGKTFIDAFGEEPSDRFVSFIATPEKTHAGKEYYERMVTEKKSDEEIEWFFSELFQYLIYRLKH